MVSWPQPDDPRTRMLLGALISGLAAKVRFYCRPGVSGFTATIRRMCQFVGATGYPPMLVGVFTCSCLAAQRSSFGLLVALFVCLFACLTLFVCLTLLDVVCVCLDFACLHVCLFVCLVDFVCFFCVLCCARPIPNYHVCNGQR